jgi:hypothetical protein
MKIVKVITAVAITMLMVTSCYWVPTESKPGRLSVTVSLPRGVVPPDTYTDAFRIYLYEASGVSALYGSPATSPTPANRSDSIEVTVKGSPIKLDGYDYYDVALPSSFDIYNTASGNFEIPDVLPGKKYRIHMQYGMYDPAPDFYGNYEGVSEAFEVAAGGIVDVALDLYYSYVGFGYGGY